MLPLLTLGLAVRAADGPAIEAGIDLVEQLGTQLRENPRDAEAFMQLGRLALEHDSEQVAAMAFRVVMRLKPDHEDAYAKILELEGDSPLPENAARRAALLKEFGDGFKAMLTPHYLVIYNTNENWARSRAGMLKVTHKHFFHVFQKADYKPLPLKQRLVCVLFKDHQSFADYARATDGADMSWSGGYYSHKTNRIAFYDDRTNPEHRAVTARVEALESLIPDLRDQLLRTSRDDDQQQIIRERLSKAARELRWYKNRQRAVNKMNNTAKTAHEAVHQLSFNTGLQQRHVAQPVWLIEGLAANFEPDAPFKQFGPYADNPARRSRLVEAFRRDRLEPLSDFMARPHISAVDRERAIDHYAQCWGMYAFLFRKKPDALRAYTMDLAAAPRGPRSAESLMAQLTEHFGPSEQLEREWIAFLRTLRP